MFCGPETVDVSRGEAEERRRKVPQINQICVKRITFYLTWLREALWICYLPVNKSNVHRLATLPGRQ